MARPVLETTPPTEEPHRRVQQRLYWPGALAPDRLSDEGFGGERHADHHEKRERQHLDRRMAVDELADGLAATSITPTDATTAVTVTPIWFTMSTAVMPESSENTMSMTAIWPMMAPEHGLLRRGRDHRCLAGPVLVTRLDEDFVRRLVQEKYSAEQQHDVSPAEALSHHGEEIGRQAHDPSER